jgi:hypothetical protein
VRKPRGIINDEAKELVRLQRAAGGTYIGHEMTQYEADTEIRRLQR